jgi:hypothetical protein
MLRSGHGDNIYNFLACLNTSLEAHSDFRSEFVEHLSPSLVAQQSMTQIIPVTVMNFVTPKARA